MVKITLASSVISSSSAGAGGDEGPRAAPPRPPAGIETESTSPALVKCAFVGGCVQHTELFIHPLKLHSTQPVGFPTLHGAVIYLRAPIHF